MAKPNFNFIKRQKELEKKKKKEEKALRKQEKNAVGVDNVDNLPEDEVVEE